MKPVYIFNRVTSWEGVDFVPDIQFGCQYFLHFSNSSVTLVECEPHCDAYEDAFHYAMRELCCPIESIEYKIIASDPNGGIKSADFKHIFKTQPIFCEDEPLRIHCKLATYRSLKPFKTMSKVFFTQFVS